MFFDKKLSESFDFYYLEPGLDPCNTDIVKAMITLIQEGHSHNENYITVKVSRRTQKVEIYRAKERSGLVFFNRDQEHLLGSNVGKEFGIM